jgi:hypothetical protein
MRVMRQVRPSRTMSLTTTVQTTSVVVPSGR